MLWLIHFEFLRLLRIWHPAIGMPRRTILYTDERRHNRPPGGEIVELSTALALGLSVRVHIIISSAQIIGKRVLVAALTQQAGHERCSLTWVDATYTSPS